MNKRLHKALSFISGLSLVFNSLLPASAVFAQEIIPTDIPTPTEEITPTPEIIITEAPTPTPTEEPTITPTPEITETPTEALTPTEEVTPTIEPTTEVTPEATTTEPPHETGPPANEGQILDGASTVAPTPTEEVTPTITPEEPEQGQLDALIIDNVKADTLDLDSVDPSTSGTITTDKADYAPTDTAIISGTGFKPNHKYDLTVKSDDTPATSTTVEIETDADGAFIYAYQLDGTYRPNYKVEVTRNAVLIAETSFTDAPISGTIIDSDGPNDEPGQKDLNQMFYDYSDVLTGSIDVAWNWDDAGFPGANTGDACALFDTDTDGYANYALCVTVANDPATWQATSLYSCGDNRPDRCTSEVAISPFSSTCGVSVQATDPFPGPPAASKGDYFPDDTVASCTTQLSDVGGSSSQLLDVCSFPSSISHSDPSDCIVASTANQTGLLEIKKALSPIDDSGLFNLQIDATTYAFDVGNNGSTGEKVVEAGNHTFNEIAGTSTSLSNYTTTVQCLNSAGAPLSTTGSFPWTIDVENNADIVCTITNTRINNGSITIVKDAVPNDAQDFSFITTGSGLSTFSLDDDSDATLSNTKVFSDLAAGTYSVEESAVTGWTQTSASCNDGSPVSAIELSAGETVTCTFINTKLGRIIVDKVTDPSGDPQSFTFTPSYGASFGLTDASTPNTSPDLMPGTYTVTETVPAGWDLTSATCSDRSDPSAITLGAGETVTCTFNNQKDAHIIIEKQTIPDGDQTLFDFDLSYGDGDADLTDGQSDNSGDLNPGTYTVSENTPVGWDLTSAICSDGSNPSSIALVAGETVTCTFTNTKLPTLTVTKVLLPSDNYGRFDLKIDGTVYANAVGDGGTTGPRIVSVGSHTFGETAVSPTNINNYIKSYGGDTGCNTNGTITLAAGENKTCTITNTTLGSVQVRKDVIPNDSSTWDITLTGPGGPYTHTISEGSPYVFSYLPAGSYTVTETTSNDYIPSVSCSTKGSNQSGSMTFDLSVGENITCTFTNIKKGSVSGQKYNDVNGDGDKDGGDSGLSAWTIKLMDETGNAELASTTTDGSGNYSFSNVIPGSYRVCEINQAGYTNTDPGDGITSPVCKSISVTAGQNTVTDFGNFQLGQITACKYIDIDGDNTSDEMLPGIDITLSDITHLIATKETGESGCVTFDGLTAGAYQIAEDYTDPDLADYYSTDQITSHNVNITSGSNETVNFLNSPYRTISGTKYNDLNGNGSKDAGEPGLSNWTIFIDYNNNGIYEPGDGEPSRITDVNGYYEFTGLAADSYTLTEDQQLGWTQTDPDTGHYDLNMNTNISSPNNDFGNVQKRDIHGFKWNDIDGDGQYGDEELLSGWTIFLDLNTNGVLDSEEPSMVTSSETEHFGWYWFENLLPGTYSVCEVAQGGWNQTSTPVCHTVILPDGENTCGPRMVNYTAQEQPTCNFGNKQLNPILTITKQNLAGGDKSPGDSVLFEITVTATQSAAFNVEVTDLLPTGFTYRPGSWTANTDNLSRGVAGDLKAGNITTEPTYASPGVWQLGDMAINEKVTLTYIADISGSQQSGRYYDLAWAAGCKTNETCTNDVIALALPLGYVAENYVGTEVNIVTNTQNGLSHNVITTVEGEVLGASTELPATGANTFWLYVAFSLITGGLTLGTLGWFLRRKYA